MLSYEESLKILKETNALLDGHFILSSGLHSAQYIQCAQLLSKPQKSANFCKSLAEKISKELNQFLLILEIFFQQVICKNQQTYVVCLKVVRIERTEHYVDLKKVQSDLLIMH